MFKNKEEREKFLENYRQWGLWKEIPELDVKLYRYEFETGTALIATEHSCMMFAGFEKGRSLYEKGRSVLYHLLLSESDEYKVPFDKGESKLYIPTGDSRSMIINYLTNKCAKKSKEHVVELDMQ